MVAGCSHDNDQGQARCKQQGLLACFAMPGRDWRHLWRPLTILKCDEEGEEQHVDQQSLMQLNVLS